MSQGSRCLLWIAGVCTLLAIAGCGSAQSRFAGHLEHSRHFLSEGNLEKAGVEVRNALQIQPHSAPALLLNGQIAEKRGNPREAFASYQAAIEADPDDTRARASAARLLIFSGAADRAVPLLDAGLHRHPNAPELLVARAAARAQLKDLAGAVADAERGLATAPDDADAVALLAALYQRQGNLQNAIALVDGAVTRRPGSLDLRQVLASLYLAAHEEARCEEQLKIIVARAPRELAPRNELAAFYVRTGNLAAAQATLNDAVATFPDSTQAKLALVDFSVQHETPARGQAVLRGFIEQAPANGSLRLALATLQQATGAPEAALASYDELIVRQPQSPEALLARDRAAAIEIGMGRIEPARARIAAVLKANPRDADALLMRARLALNEGRAAPAIEDLRAVVRDQPTSVDAQRLLAHAYTLNHEASLAETTLRTALQNAPANALLQRDLAQTLLEGGNAAAGVTLLEESVRRSPSNPGTRELLVRAYLAKGDLLAARTAAEDLRTLAPTAAVAPYLAGVIAQQQSRPEDARRDFEQALKLQPGASDALAALTKLQLAHGEAKAALARLRALTLAEPKNAFALNLLGEALIDTREFKGAKVVAVRASELAPQWPAPYHTLASAELGTGDVPGAEVAYQGGLRHIPFDPLLTAGLAQLYEQQGDPTHAIALYEGLHAHDPASEVVSNNLAMLLVTYRTDRGSLDRARELTAGFSSSSSSSLLDTQGWVRLKLGQVDDALPILERAVDRAPQSSVIHYHLAMAQLQAGERDKARTNLETALAGPGSFTGSDEARAVLNTLTAGSKS